MKNLFITLLLITSFMVQACPEGFIPQNDLKIPVMDKDANITEADFKAVIEEVTEIYSPIISSRGGKLLVEYYWENETVNAYAQRKNGNWVISMFGGLARHKHITRDGFSLVVCHEIGHHVGGFPNYSGMDNGWASNEGQADYFSTLKCLRKLWEREDNARALNGVTIHPLVISSCSENWKSKADRELCMRSSMAGESVAKLFAALAWAWFMPKFDKPSTKVVKSTIDYHPPFQCRMDTYFQGALCTVPHTDELSQTSETEGTCQQSLGHKNGMRPSCWFTVKN